MNDRKGVALALVATFLIIISDEILNRNRAPKPRRVVAFAVSFLLLGFLVEIPATAKVAKYFAVLLFVGTAYKVGPQVFARASKALVTPKKAVQTHSKGAVLP